MMAFLKSDLFLRFAAGFVLGTIGVVAINSHEPVAMASTHTGILDTSTGAVHAAR